MPTPGLKTRTHNCLVSLLGTTDNWEAPIAPLAVARFTPAELSRAENFGKVTLQDVREWLASHGMHLRNDGQGAGPIAEPAAIAQVFRASTALWQAKAALERSMKAIDAALDDLNGLDH